MLRRPQNTKKQPQKGAKSPARPSRNQNEIAAKERKDRKEKPHKFLSLRSLQCNTEESRNSNKIPALDLPGECSSQGNVCQGNGGGRRLGYSPGRIRGICEIRGKIFAIMSDFDILQCKTRRTFALSAPFRGPFLVFNPTASSVTLARAGKRPFDGPETLHTSPGQVVREIAASDHAKPIAGHPTL